MQYNDPTNLNGIVQHNETYLGLPTGTFVGDNLKKITAFNNDAYLELVYDVIQTQGEWNNDDHQATDYSLVENDLVADQRDYPYPATLRLLKVKRVDISYDGVTFYRAQAYNTRNTSLTREALDNATSPVAPLYEMVGNAFQIYPLPKESTGEIRVEFDRYPELFEDTDTTKEPMLDPIFHELVAMGGSLRWAVSKRMEVAHDLKGLYDQGRLQMRDWYGSKNKDERLAIVPTVNIEQYS